jgi:hypothetical protein
MKRLMGSFLCVAILFGFIDRCSAQYHDIHLPKVDLDKLCTDKWAAIYSSSQAGIESPCLYMSWPLDQFILGRMVLHRYVDSSPDCYEEMGKSAAESRDGAERPGGERIWNRQYVLDYVADRTRKALTITDTGERGRELVRLIPFYCHLEDAGLAPTRIDVIVPPSQAPIARVYDLFWEGAGDREWNAACKSFGVYDLNSCYLSMEVSAYVPRKFVEKALGLLREKGRSSGEPEEVIGAYEMLEYRAYEKALGKRATYPSICYPKRLRYYPRQAQPAFSLSGTGKRNR